jgi:hypothetical protein
MYGQTPTIRFSLELPVAGVLLLMVLSDVQRFAQLLNSDLESASSALVILVFLRKTGHLSLEPLKAGEGVEDNTGACGWGDTRHKMCNS